MGMQAASHGKRRLRLAGDGVASLVAGHRKTRVAGGARAGGRCERREAPHPVWKGSSTS